MCFKTVSWNIHEDILFWICVKSWFDHIGDSVTVLVDSSILNLFSSGFLIPVCVALISLSFLFLPGLPACLSSNSISLHPFKDLPGHFCFLDRPVSLSHFSFLIQTLAISHIPVLLTVFHSLYCSDSVTRMFYYFSSSSIWYRPPPTSQQASANRERGCSGMTQSRLTDLGHSVTAGGTLQPSVPFVAVSASLCMNETGRRRTTMLLFCHRYLAFFLCFCIHECDPMHGKCLSFSVHEKRAKAQWENEDKAANLINMDGLLHACVCTCGWRCALLCVFLNTCVWLLIVI